MLLYRPHPLQLWLYPLKPLSPCCTQPLRQSHCECLTAAVGVASSWIFSSVEFLPPPIIHPPSCVLTLWVGSQGAWSGPCFCCCSCSSFWAWWCGWSQRCGLVAPGVSVLGAWSGPCCSLMSLSPTMDSSDWSQPFIWTRLIGHCHSLWTYILITDTCINFYSHHRH